MKNVKKIGSTFAMLGLIGALGLTGCAESNTKSEDAENPVVSTDFKTFDCYIEEPEDKILEPYEHCFFLQYKAPMVKDEDTLSWKHKIYMNSGSLEIPEGYIVLGVTSIATGGGDNPSCGLYLLLTNEVEVKVSPVYNEYTFGYDYGTPGIPTSKIEDMGNEYTLKK